MLYLLEQHFFNNLALKPFNFCFATLYGMNCHSFFIQRKLTKFKKDINYFISAFPSAKHIQEIYLFIFLHIHPNCLNPRNN